MNYGWVDPDVAPQKDGFFVDEDNRILYWPSRDGAGYIIDFQCALNISFLSNEAKNNKFVIIGLVIYLLPICFPLSYVLDHLFDLSFSSKDFYILLALVGTPIVYGVYWYRFGRRWFFRKVSILLAGRETVHRQRPKPQTIKTSEKAGKKQFWFALLGLIILTVFSFSLPSFEEKKIADSIAYAMGIMFMFYIIFFIWREWSGMRIQDIRFLVSSN